MLSQIPESTREEIERAIFEHEKIKAIKLYRRSTGAKLMDSKRAIEEFADELRSAHPERFLPEPVRSGCLGVIGVSFALLGALLWRVTG
jgi:hypothetical protein